MKTKLLLLISFFACHVIFAQSNTGISVQGIARDANKAALVDELMTFTFEIVGDEDGESFYKENVDIKTDPYGVFSHIIGTGTVVGGDNFNEIPFGQVHMRLVISAEGEVISNKPFQYVPYAMSAANGVPPGTIVAFAGKEENIPNGWVLCDGRSLTTIDNSQNLIDLIGNNVPDLRGMFLRGTGTSPVNGEDGPLLGETQGDDFKKHSISGTTSDNGSHSHKTYFSVSDVGGSPTQWMAELGDGDSKAANVGADFTVYTSTEPNHHHTISGTSTDGGNETRPVNYGVHYIIKL